MPVTLRKRNKKINYKEKSLKYCAGIYGGMCFTHNIKKNEYDRMVEFYHNDTEHYIIKHICMPGTGTGSTKDALRCVVWLHNEKPQSMPLDVLMEWQPYREWLQKHNALSTLAKRFKKKENIQGLWLTNSYGIVKIVDKINNRNYTGPLSYFNALACGEPLDQSNNEDELTEKIVLDSPELIEAVKEITDTILESGKKKYIKEFEWSILNASNTMVCICTYNTFPI